MERRSVVPARTAYALAVLVWVYLVVSCQARPTNCLIGNKISEPGIKGGNMAIAVVDAARLAKTSQRRYKRLLECQEELQKARRTLYEEALVPFLEAFQRLQHVDLVGPATIEMSALGGGVSLELRRLRNRSVMAAVGVLAERTFFIAGGTLACALAGYGAQAGAYRAAKTFASASTGRPISKLYGAAARNATEAWWGRGPIAAGGGGRAAGKRVLSGIGTASANLSRVVGVEWYSSRAHRGQQQMALDLEQAEAEMSTVINAASALCERGKDLQRVLQDLEFMLVGRLPSFAALVEACDDFARYDSRGRAEVAAMVDLADLAVLVMNCPVIDADGRLTEASGRVVADAEARLRAMQHGS